MNKISPGPSHSMLTLTTGSQRVVRCKQLTEEYDFTSFCSCFTVSNMFDYIKIADR